MALTFASYTSPAWLDAGNTILEAMVTFKELPAPVLYTASANDPDPTGAKIFELIKANAALQPAPQTGLAPPVIPIASYVPPSSAQALASAQARQLTALKASCRSAIIGGYQSSALGAAHTYPSTQTDQINMLGSVSASVLPNLPANWTTVFWCADATGAWAIRPHTAAQIQQAGSDGKAWVTTCQVKLATLSAEVLAATTVAAVQAVVW